MPRRRFVLLRQIPIALARHSVYVAPMTRISSALIVILLALLPALAVAAPAHKRPPQKWHGYGFLPGYRQPVNNSVPVYGVNGSLASRAGTKGRRWYIDPTPRYYGYDDEWHYFGRPGFYRGHYNGGSLGPCWTRTPVGLVWNCG
ncbi:MAG: hypothetical protein V7634_3749 [Bradyrhizobium sp.]